MREHELFKGLAEQTRLRIVVLLLERELCVCDILEVLRLPQSTVSRHMTRLKAAGLVLDRREGKWVHYRLQEIPIVHDLRGLLRRHLINEEPYKCDLVTLRGYVASGNCASVK